MSKTCGECKHYNDAMFHCEKFDCMAEDSWSCPDCEEKEKPKLTNGDVIRQMSNEELANRLYNTIHDCFWCPLSQTCDRDDGCDCELLLLDWLNAPAESEGENEYL